MAQWRKIIVSGSNAELSHLSMSGDIDLTGNITGSSTSTGSFGYLAVSGDTTIGGNITFGDANTDFVSFSADIDSNLIPNSDDTYDIGSATQAWQDLFLEGDITLTDAGKVVTTAGNLTVDSEAATLVLDGHTGVDIDASNSGKVSIDGAGGIDIGVAADVAIDIDSAALDIDASGAITVDGTSTFSVDVDGATNINTSVGNITVDSEAGNLVLDGHTGVDIDASNSGKVAIDGAGGIDIGVAADVAIDVDSSTFDLDASGALTMTSTTMALDPSSTFDLDAAGAVTIDGSAITIGADDSGVAISIGHSTSETTINDNLTVTGDLDVNGTLTTIDTTNLRVADRFIQVASGSTTGDGGMVVTTAANGSGSALFWDDSATRWGLTGADETGDSQISADPRQFVVSVSGSAVDASSNPSDFGGAAANRIGMMHVNTATGDIFIFS
jgi:hypothetical protein